MTAVFLALSGQFTFPPFPIIHFLIRGRRLKSDEQVGASPLLFIAIIDFRPCIIDPCLSNPCEHGGDCLVSGDTFTCSCPAPFSGNRCQNGECSFTGFLLPSELNKRQFLLQLKGVKRAEWFMERVRTIHVVSSIMDSSAWKQAASHWILTHAYWLDGYVHSIDGNTEAKRR